MSRTENQPATDIHTYISEYPEFTMCRRSGHDRWYDGPEGPTRDKPNFVKSDGDPLCTHERVSWCKRCGQTRRERVVAYRSGSETHYARLTSQYSGTPEGFAAVGRHIYAGDIDFAEIEGSLLAEEAAGRRRGRKRAGGG
jgi:hypothetical protein